MVLFPPGVTFCYWIVLFSCSKESDANIGIIANFVYFLKNPVEFEPVRINLPKLQFSANVTDCLICADGEDEVSQMKPVDIVTHRQRSCVRVMFSGVFVHKG